MKVFWYGMLGFFRFTSLRFVRKHHEHDDIYTFYFRPGRLVQRAGQHGLFIIPSLGMFGFRLFSLSSAPEEKYVTITTHIGSNSRYKRRLMRLKAGQMIILCGPILFFFLRPRVTDYVFLAQGIGITPFRSLLLHSEKARQGIRTTLVHVAQEPHLFRKVTERAATESYYVMSPEAFTATVHPITQQPHELYFISGSRRFVRATKKTLRGLGIKRNRMKSDNFLGY